MVGTSGDPDALRIAIERLRAGHRTYPLQLCITRGGDGALLWADGRWHSQPAVPVKGVDTVGAGESFLAMLLAQRLRGVAPALALQREAALGSFVASRAGAVPDYDPRQLFRFRPELVPQRQRRGARAQRTGAHDATGAAVPSSTSVTTNLSVRLFTFSDIDSASLKR
jgi:hypothetical protein